jgi:ribonuclease P/MRP protein subunit POP3
MMASNGKRAKKRQKRLAEASYVAPNLQTPIVALPELSSHILVGLSSVVRHLELLSQSIHASSLQTRSDCSDTLVIKKHSKLKESRHLAAVFVTSFSQPTILHAHLPQLIGMASRAQSNLPPIRLVQLPRGCEQRLCESLGLPRAGFIGLFDDAPYSAPLLAFLMDNVSAIDIDWLKEAQTVEYIPLQVNTVETFVSSRRTPGKCS